MKISSVIEDIIWRNQRKFCKVLLFHAWMVRAVIWKSLFLSEQARNRRDWNVANDCCVDCQWQHASACFSRMRRYSIIAWRNVHFSTRWIASACGKSDSAVASSSLSRLYWQRRTWPGHQSTWLSCLGVDVEEVRSLESSAEGHPVTEVSTYEDLRRVITRRNMHIDHECSLTSESVCERV